MKKFLSLVLAAACMPMMLLASCASGGAGAYSPKITVASSDAEDSAEFLTDRLGDKLTDNVYLAVGSDTANGIDMTDFENDGYVLRTVGDKSVVIVGKSADGLDLGVRRYANSVDDGKDEYFDVAYHEGYRIENFTLAGTDIAEYSIEYPAEHNENMLFAVSELQRLVKKACGAELSASEGITKKAHAIEFRHSTDAELKFDGYRYFFEGERLVIEGAVKRGCMYGVWRFLQKECGWTSLIYGDSDLLEAEHLDVPATASRQETPVFSYLNMYWNGWGSYNDDKGYPNTVQNSYGIMPQCCHGLYRFSEVNVMGKQICYTDEDIYELCRDNIRSYTWRDQELGFLAGFLGASLSDTNTLGFIGAHDIPLCNLGAAGMIAGAHYANPDCQVLVDYANGWAEVNGCYELATSMHEQGASLLYHTASAGGLGILNAGKEKNFLTIFFDGNLNADAPQTNIASAIRDFPACAQEAIQDVIDGKFTAGAIEKGLAENSLYLDFDGSAYQIPADVMEKYNAAVAAIKDGTIVVPSTIEEAKVWKAA